MKPWILVDLSRNIVGSTSYTGSTEGLFRAVHPTTGEDWGTVEVKPFDWPRERVNQKDLEKLTIIPID
jgi:hypothetical protein